MISIEADYSGPTRLHLITDDAENFGLFDADCFLTIDQSVPSNWVARIREDGILDLSPSPWLADGFWEAYYDGDSVAAEKVAKELRVIKGELFS